MNRRRFIASTAAAFAAGAAARGAAQAAPAELDAGSAAFLDFALASDANSLTDRESPVNRRWVGTTGEELAELVRVDARLGSARIRLRSVDVETSAPLGWHAIEDAERAAIFTPDGSVRLIFWRVDLSFEGTASIEAYVAQKQTAIKARHPGVRTRSYRGRDGAWVVVYEDVPARRGDTERRTIHDLLIPNPRNAKHALLVTLGVPASKAGTYLPLLALVARDLAPAWRSDR